jgi:tetratricopeptide (TPR) repeat protein
MPCTGGQCYPAPVRVSRHPPRLRLALIAGALAAVAVGPADARSPLLAQLSTVAATYHEDPTRLDRLRQSLEEATKADPRVENLLALSQVCFMWGDVRARNREEKLEAYERGRQVGQRAVELAPTSVAAHFWYATNTARWGQVNGVVRSLFLLPTVRAEIESMLKLDPGFAPLYALAGNVDYEVPAALGGSLERAEAMYRKGLELDPRLTVTRVGLAKVLIKQGRVEDARQELNAVLQEKRPTMPADWAVKDTRSARRLLDSIAAR